MEKPIRLQLSRRKGFRLQELSLGLNGLEAVKVTRPGVFGNPFTAKAAREIGYLRNTPGPLDNLFLRDSFAQWVGYKYAGPTPWMGDESDATLERLKANLSRLKNKNLACFCKPGDPCHADILIAMCEEI